METSGRIMYYLNCNNNKKVFGNLRSFEDFLSVIVGFFRFLSCYCHPLDSDWYGTEVFCLIMMMLTIMMLINMVMMILMVMIIVLLTMMMITKVMMIKLMMSVMMRIMVMMMIMMMTTMTTTTTKTTKKTSTRTATNIYIYILYWCHYPHTSRSQLVSCMLDFLPWSLAEKQAMAPPVRMVSRDAGESTKDG